MTTDEEVLKLMEEFASKVMEHGDSVRVFITAHHGDKESTKTYTIGRGNFYAQLGQIHEWKTEQEEITKKDVEDE